MKNPIIAVIQLLRKEPSGENEVNMGEVYEIIIPNNYSLERTILCHGWVFLDPFRYEAGVLSFAFTSDSGVCHFVSVKQFENRVQVASSGKLSDAALQQVARVIATDELTERLMQTAKKLSKGAYDLVRSGSGRMLKSPTLWEDLAKTLLTTNCNWRKTQSMVTNLCAEFGFVVEGVSAFPTASIIAEADDDSLKGCGLGYRVGYLKALAKMCDCGALDECEADVSTEKRVELLNSVKGFGHYSVSHALVLLRDYSRIPIDSDSTAYLKKLGFEGKAMHDAYASWDKYRFWGYKLGRIARKMNWIGD